MSLAVKSAQMALWDWDVANDRVWMTDEGRKFFSFEPDEPLHYESLAGRVHPDDSAVRATAIQQVLESGGSYEAEYRIILPDGAVRWVAARGHRPSPEMTHLQTLFQPFHTTKAGGLGLGLSICRTLVTSHGGRLWAERRPERGAAFYVALPLAKADA